ncbi:MAG: 4Fe-4S dicluster domain-containing protein [Candidatus Heimdallarchaeota archaeon]|nr:MAG: 4Fe-4S dicluster domain-containing protein [Candidatus Heimdallarchaeota archaeon]
MSPKIAINHDVCIHCLKCVRSCPAEILISESSKTQKGIIKVIDPKSCFECRACEVICPENAINVMCAIENESAP